MPLLSSTFPSVSSLVFQGMALTYLRTAPHSPVLATRHTAYILPRPLSVSCETSTKYFNIPYSCTLHTLGLNLGCRERECSQMRKSRVYSLIPCQIRHNTSRRPRFYSSRDQVIVRPTRKAVGNNMGNSMDKDLQSSNFS